MSDIKDKESPAVVQRTFDPTHELAKKAKDPELRIEVYASNSKWKFRYVECLRFAGVIYGDHDLTDTPCVLTFSKGEHSVGRGFISATKMRKMFVEDQRTKCPLYAQVWELTPTYRDPQEDRKWWGFDFKPAENPTIDADDFMKFAEAHIELAALHEEDRIRVDGDDSETLDEDNESEKFE
jgi:hypothetical protein